jgi:hypothetical protein
MNPIPSSFPSSNPPTRETHPASSDSNAERIQQFEQLLDKQTSGVKDRQTDHSEKTQGKEASSAKESKEKKHAIQSDSDSSQAIKSGEDDSSTVEAAGDAETSIEPTGTLLADAVHARKKRDHGGDGSAGDGSQGSQYGAGVPIPVDHSQDISLSQISRASATEAAGRIEQIAALIAQTAQQVTFDGNDRALITLSPEQLPDSKLIIQMTQQVVQVTFMSDNASSLALLQARGGEVAAALALRFDKEIRIEVKDGGDGSDAGDSGTTRASWAIQGNSGNSSTSGNA